MTRHKLKNSSKINELNYNDNLSVDDLIVSLDDELINIEDYIMNEILKILNVLRRTLMKNMIIILCESIKI